MKKNKFLSFVLIFTILSAYFVSPTALAVSDPTPSSNCVVLLDTVTGNILYTKNDSSKAYPASLTKIMTVMLAVEAIEEGKVALTDSVTAGDDINADLSEDGSTSGIVPGETMSLENLIYCAMLSSANEACNIIAEYIGGDLQTFVGMMNTRAQELGCIGTHFVNTHGYPDTNHYTTASDFAIIAREAVSHTLFMQICNTATKTVPATNVAGERSLSNTNGLINNESDLYPGYYYQYAAGVKTGHTSDAGYCLVSTATKDGITLLCVVMGGKAIESGGTKYGNFEDSILLYNWAFENFSYRNILETTALVEDISVKMGKDTDFVTVHPETAVKALMPNDEDTSSFEQKITIYSEETGEDLVAPIEAGEVLGNVSIVRDGVVYGTSQLVACSSVDLSYTQFIKAKVINTLKKPLVIIFILFVLALFGMYIYLVVRYQKEKKKHLKNLEMRRRASARAMAEQQKSVSRSRKITDSQKAFDVELPEKPELDYSIAETSEKEDEFKAERDYFEEFFGKNRTSK